MQQTHRDALQRMLLHLPRHRLGAVRHASLTSAINRGIRRGADKVGRLGTTPRNPQNQDSQTLAPRTRFEIERSERSARTPKKPWSRDKEPQFETSFEAPFGVPYTTAGSEFIYGTFAVRAALEAKRRLLHKIYIWRGERGSGDEYDESILRLARSKRVHVQNVAGSWDKMLLKMSGQRPHNGYVLEASPVPKLPVVSLNRMDNPKSAFSVTVSPRSAEDEAINSTFKADGSHASIARSRPNQRYPLLLWLDRITDTGNMGAIIRTAYFFGVDAIIVPEHGTAPFSPITVKASAGAAEHVPILTVRRELDFVQKSKQNGWKFFAAVAPESESAGLRSQGASGSVVASALDLSPCVLVVGNEGEGLRGFLQKAADEPLSIQGVKGISGVIDSLNVSVAAALLVSRFIEPAGRIEPATASDSAEHNELPDGNGSTKMF